MITTRTVVLVTLPALLATAVALYVCTRYFGRAQLAGVLAFCGVGLAILGGGLFTFNRDDESRRRFGYGTMSQYRRKPWEDY